VRLKVGRRKAQLATPDAIELAGELLGLIGGGCQAPDPIGPAAPSDRSGRLSRGPPGGRTIEEPAPFWAALAGFLNRDGFAAQETALAADESRLVAPIAAPIARVEVGR
jgi:hypothetical protein